MVINDTHKSTILAALVESKLNRGAMTDDEYEAWQTECEAAIAALNQPEQGMLAELREVEQVLGRALGYPRYCDDQANFPGATEADGVCVGDHTAGTLAQEAAQRIAELQAQQGELLTMVQDLLHLTYTADHNWEDGDYARRDEIAKRLTELGSEAEAIAAWNRRATPQAMPMPAPKWDEAPEWAEWWAVDANGWSNWYRTEPYCDDDEGACWCPQPIVVDGISEIDSPMYDQKVYIPLGIDWRTLQSQRTQSKE